MWSRPSGCCGKFAGDLGTDVVHLRPSTRALHGGAGEDRVGRDL